MASAAANAARGAYRLWVGNLSWTVSKHELAAYFSQFGKVQEATVAFHQDTLLSRGYGFVSFQRSQSAQDVLAKGNHVLEGREITVKSPLTR